MRQDGRQGIGNDLDIAGQDGGEHGRGSAVGHVHNIDTGFELEHFGEEVRPGAESLRAPADLPRVGLGVGHDLSQRVCRQVHVHGNDLRQFDQASNRRKRLGRIIADVAVHSRACCQCAPGSDKKGVAVRLGGGDRLGTDAAAGSAAAILDDNRLAQHSPETVRDHARHVVGGPAGRERHHHSDRTVRIGFRRGLRLVLRAREVGGI